MTIPLSVVVMTKNEERNIQRCLRALESFGEVFVVDSLSTDRTVELATKEGARVIPFRWNGQYPKKKQWALENVSFSYDWVLFVDADEIVQPELERELCDLFIRGPSAAAYSIQLDYVFEGRRLRFGQRVEKIALFRRSAGRFVDLSDLHVDRMWEVEGHYQPVIDGELGRLRGRLLHHDHDSLFSYFERHNRYSDWEAALSLDNALALGEESGRPFRRIAKRTFHRLPLRALIFFAYTYIFRLGFLDGPPGLHYAVSKSFYYWQVQAKVRELQRSRLQVG